MQPLVIKTVQDNHRINKSMFVQNKNNGIMIEFVAEPCKINRLFSSDTICLSYLRVQGSNIV